MGSPPEQARLKNQNEDTERQTLRRASRASCTAPFPMGQWWQRSPEARVGRTQGSAKEVWRRWMEESKQQQADCTNASEMALGTETVDGGPRQVSHPGRGRDWSRKFRRNMGRPRPGRKD